MFKPGDQIKLKSEYSHNNWWTNKIYTIISINIDADILVLNENLKSYYNYRTGKVVCSNEINYTFVRYSTNEEIKKLRVGKLKKLESI